MSSPDPPRYAPDRPFPPYAFTGSGRGDPHPREPGGHSHGADDEPPPALDVDDWQRSETYLHAVDLFNHGYYWESHEEWEGLWIAAGKRGPLAEFFKGLIKLAAAGVKMRQGQPGGVRSHARNAARHFATAREGLVREEIAGLRVQELIDRAEELSETRVCPEFPPGEATRVYHFCLRLPRDLE